MWSKSFLLELIKATWQESVSGLQDLSKAFRRHQAKCQSPQSCSYKERTFDNSLNELGSELFKLPGVSAAQLQSINVYMSVCITIIYIKPLCTNCLYISGKMDKMIIYMNIKGREITKTILKNWVRCILINNYIVTIINQGVIGTRTDN